MTRANRILEGIPKENVAQWSGGLQLVDLKVGQILCNPGENYQYVYFPLNCLLSLIANDGDQNSSITLIGNEGMIGAQLFLGDASNAFGVNVECSGEAYRLPAHFALEGVSQSGGFRSFMLNYMQALVFNVLQMALCDSKHSISQRVAKALLISDDRQSGSESAIGKILIEKIAGIPGNRVSQTLFDLEARGAIKLEDGLALIINRADLEKATCECYRAAIDEFDRLLANPFEGA